MVEPRPSAPQALRGCAPPDSAHVAAGIVYGPVRSRRFGLSLGLSFTDPTHWSCSWNCPYCQVGHLHPAKAFLASAAILGTLDAWLARGGTADVLCIAGNGEPSLHPDFAMLIPAIVGRCAPRGLRCVLLTNADGLIADIERRAAVAALDECWCKWDPGPRHGAWRSLGDAETAERMHVLSRMPDLRIQSLLYHGPGRHLGNDYDAMRQRWQEEMLRLAPVQVHLTTLDRPDRHDALRPLPTALLAERAEELGKLLGCPVTAYGACNAADAVGG